MPGRFDELGVVECDQCLQRRVGAFAADGASFTRGGVEDFHRGRWGGTFDERVETASIEAFAGVPFVVAGVAAEHRDRFPDSFGLVRLHAGTAQLGDEQAARRQCVIADHFGIHAEARAARQQFIGRILFKLFLRRDSRLAVRRRGDEQLEEPFDVPRSLRVLGEVEFGNKRRSPLSELVGQPVEQFLV